MNSVRPISHQISIGHSPCLTDRSCSAQRRRLTFCRLTAKSRFFLSAVKRRVGKEERERGKEGEGSITRVLLLPRSAINYEAVKERNRLQMRMRCSRAERERENAGI